MAGFLPTGTGGVSLFWSIRLDRIDHVLARGVEAFRDDLLSLAPRAEGLAFTSLDAFEAVRRRQARFYAFGARALNTVFRNDWDVMAWPRDRLMPPVSRLPWVRGRALDVLAGRADGLFTSVD